MDLESVSYSVESFDPSPDEELVCSICRCVFKDPYECSCRHIFCRECINNWLNRRKSCPICRQSTYSFDLQPVAPIIKNMISKLQMQCPNLANGCKDKVLLGNYAAHLKRCEHSFILCTNDKCDVQCLRKDIDFHQTKVCQYRLVCCELDCNLKLSASKISQHNCVKELKAVIAENGKTENMLRSQIEDLNSEIEAIKNKLHDLEQRRIPPYSPVSLSNDTISSINSSDSNNSIISNPFVYGMLFSDFLERNSHYNDTYPLNIERVNRNSSESSFQFSDDEVANTFLDEPTQNNPEVQNAISEIRNIGSRLRDILNEFSTSIGAIRNEAASLQDESREGTFPNFTVASQNDNLSLDNFGFNSDNSSPILEEISSDSSFSLSFFPSSSSNSSASLDLNSGRSNSSLEIPTEAQRQFLKRRYNPTLPEQSSSDSSSSASIPTQRSRLISISSNESFDLPGSVSFSTSSDESNITASTPIPISRIPIPVNTIRHNFIFNDDSDSDVVELDENSNDSYEVEVPPRTWDLIERYGDISETDSSDVEWQPL